MSPGIYMVEALDQARVAFVKFGVSMYPRERVASFRSDCPLPVSCAFVVYASRQTEGRLHASLQPSRFRGEWYRPTPGVYAAAEELRKRRHHIDCRCLECVRRERLSRPVAPKLSAAQFRVLSALVQYGSARIKPAERATLRALERKGLVELTRSVDSATPLYDPVSESWLERSDT